MKRMTLILSAITLALASTTAIAKDDLQKQLQDLPRYQAVAGEPVNMFSRVIRTSISWKPLGEQHLLYYTSPAKAYLLTLDQKCTGLYRAQSLTVSGGNTVHAGVDRVTVVGSDNPGGFDCKITEIRPVNLKAYRATKGTGY